MHWEDRSSAVARQLFAATLELSQRGVLCLDDRLHLRACNQSLCRMLGYTRDELLALHLDDLRAQERRRESGPSLEQQLSEGASGESHYSFRRKDGTELHLPCSVRSNAAPGIHLLALTPVRTIGQSFTVNTESEQRLRMLIDQAPFAIQIFDLDGTLLHVNFTWEQIWGVRGEDVVGRYNVLKDQQIREMDLMDLIERVFAGQDAGSLPARQYDPTRTGVPGRQRWIELRFFHVRDEQGRLKYVCIQNEDVTERRDAEAEKQRLLTQLHQAQKMEAIGRLAGGVAHDFNNLLTGIRGFVDLILLDGEPAPPTGPYLREIAKAADRAAGLTSQLLAFSRRQVIEPIVLSLQELIADSASMISRLIGEDIELSVVASEADDRILADPHQINQILMNLASNSRDAMPEGGVLIIETSRGVLDEQYCAGHPGVVPGEYVVLSVSDTGMGMDAETRHRAFEPFFTSKERGRGTGLGLATVYGVAKQNGGHVELRSEPGVGTTIRVYLPASEGAIAPAKSLAPADARGSETILLVEDEDVIRSLAKETLSLKGYTVKVAETPTRALALVDQSQSPIHLLLTDVIMPKMNGRELYESIHEKHPNMKVLFMSGYSESIIAHRGVIEPDIDLLSKPFTTEMLLRKVREILDQ